MTEEKKEAPRSVPQAGMPEAVASATVKVVSPRGGHWLYTVRADAHATLTDQIEVLEELWIKRGWGFEADNRNGVTYGSKAKSEPQVTAEEYAKATAVIQEAAASTEPLGESVQDGRRVCPRHPGKQARRNTAPWGVLQWTHAEPLEAKGWCNIPASSE